jgi:hypothetical protein
MSDGNEFDQFEDYDAKAAEARMKAGGMLPAGKYPAKLIGAARTESKQKQTPGWELSFEVTGNGPFSGTPVTDTIYVTENSKAKDRLVIFAHRLGVLEKKKDGSGYVKVEGKQDFTDVLDTPCVIEVIHEPDQKDPNKKWLRLAFGGVYQPGDPEAKGVGDGKAAPPKNLPPGKTTGAAAVEGKKAEEKKKVQRGEL